MSIRTKVNRHVITGTEIGRTIKTAVNEAVENVLKTRTYAASSKSHAAYLARCKRTGIKRFNVLCHESLIEEIRAIAKEKTQKIVNSHPTNGSIQEDN